MQLEDLEVHTMRVITKGLKHPLEAKYPFTKLQEKTIFGTSGILEEDFNHEIQKRAKSMSQIGSKLLL